MGESAPIPGEDDLSDLGSEDYAADWDNYRRLRRKFYLIWIGFVPALTAFTLIVARLFHTLIPSLIGAFAWIFWFLATDVEVRQFPCPRCGQAFARKYRSGRPNLWLFARECQNCGLKKYARFARN